MTQRNDTTAQKYTFHIGKDKQNKNEKVDGERLKQTIAHMFPSSGANIQEQDGTWKGEVESGSWKVEHVDMNQSATTSEIRDIAHTLENKFDQEKVLVTSKEVAVV